MQSYRNQEGEWDFASNMSIKRQIFPGGVLTEKSFNFSLSLRGELGFFVNEVIMINGQWSDWWPINFLSPRNCQKTPRETPWQAGRS